jgi:hypothetical protein
MPGHTGNDVAGALRPPLAARESRGRAGVVLAAVLAVAASAGLAWWLSGDSDHALRNSPSRPPAAEIRAEAPAPAYAAASASEDQVRRAYEEMQQTYADGGLPAVSRSAEICAGSLAGTPNVLDYCLAFSLYAQALQPKAGEVGEGARLAMARSALPPGADAAARVAEVQALTRIVAGQPPRPQSAKAPATKPARARTARPLSQVRAAHAKPAARAKAGVKSTAAKSTARAASRARTNQALRRAATACRLKATPTERAVCASPALQTADRRMRAAYGQALSSGANRRQLVRDQARWKVQATAASSDRRRLAALYDARTRELRAAARRR